MKKLLHLTLWFLVFFNGIIRLLELNVAIIRIGVPVIILILLFYTIKRSRQIIIPHIYIILLLLLTILLSGLANSIRGIQIIDFIVYIFIPYSYFVVIVNENDEKLLKFIKRLIITFFILQIPASWIKYLLVGQMESYIGTISISEGSLSTVIPMIATSYLFAKYLFKRNSVHLFLILLFVLFGIIGEKRAIVYFIPTIMMLLFFIFSIKNKNSLLFSLGNWLKMCVVGYLLVYLMITLNPTLNPENRIGGSVDLDYVMNYTIEYNKSRNISFGEIGRLDALLYFGRYLSKQDFATFMLGEGAGKLLISDQNPMLLYYDVRYAGRMGVVWLYLQIGFLGFILYVTLMISMLKNIWKHYSSCPSYHALAALGIFFSILIDTMLYSNSSLTYFAVIGVFFFISGNLYRQGRKQHESNELA